MRLKGLTINGYLRLRDDLLKQTPLEKKIDNLRPHFKNIHLIGGVVSKGIQLQKEDGDECLSDLDYGELNKICN